MSISVVIPAYNAEGFLAETLESVLAQSLLPDEILVIDDGSTDRTASVAESFGTDVRVIRRLNCGQAKSRNHGAALAAGEWIAFLDADDLWEPIKLERQMEALARIPYADLCYTARMPMMMNSDGERRFLPVVPVPPAHEIRSALYRNTTFLPSSVMVRRSTFLVTGGFDPRFRIVEDWDLWLRLLHAGTLFAACQEPLLLYRVHAGGISNNARQTLQEKDAIYRERILPHLPAPTKWFRYNRVMSQHRTNAAYVLRRGDDRACLQMLASSIVRDPFHDSHRYKVLAQMLYTRLRSEVRG